MTAVVREDVDSPDDIERLRCWAAVRNCWSRQWARVHAREKVAGNTGIAPDRAAVRISQVIRGLDRLSSSTLAISRTVDLRKL